MKLTLKEKLLFLTLVIGQAFVVGLVTGTARIWYDRQESARVGMPPEYHLITNSLGYAWVKGDRMALFICDTKEQAAKDAQNDARTK